MRIVLKAVETPVAGFYPGPFGPGKVFMFSDDLDWQSIDGRPVQPGAPPEPLAARPNLRPTAAGTHSGLNRTLRIAKSGDLSYAADVEVFQYEATWALGAVTVPKVQPTDTVINLSAGQMTSQGVWYGRNGASFGQQRFAITGGTGPYARARGELVGTGDIRTLEVDLS
jgi:hypothetical protein